MAIDKLARGLAGTLGKAIARAYVMVHPDGRSFLYLVFSDDTYYEVYGERLEGAREVRSGALAEISQMLQHGGKHMEIRDIGPPVHSPWASP